MATSTELLRAAEHMRQQSDEAFQEANSTILNRDAVVRASNYSKAADALEAEAARLRFHEERRRSLQRSWPEGWPPFAVLRRAYSATGMHHYPSTRVCERSRVRSHRVVALETRARWQRVLLQVLAEPSSP